LRISWIVASPICCSSGRPQMDKAQALIVEAFDIAYSEFYCAGKRMSTNGSDEGLRNVLGNVWTRKTPGQISPDN